MKRCPKCERFGIEYECRIGLERCLWVNCTWVNENRINLDEIYYPPKFIKFIKAVTKKLGC